MLALENLSVSYGSVQAVRGVDLEVARGQTVALLGPNGAGKSSLLKSVSGLVPVHEGKVEFDGRDITGLSVEDRAREGIAEVLEGRRIFRSLTIEENLQLATSFRARLGRRERAELLEETYTVFPLLKERRSEKAASLSGGQLQILIFAVATAIKPKLLLLDEPSLGLAPIMVKEIYAVVRRLNESGVTILLAEQLASVALETASHGYVLARGRVVKAGSSKELRDELGREGLASSYLGTDKK